MNKVRRAGRASSYLLSAAGSALSGSKPPKPPQGTVTVGELEAYVNKLVEIGRPPGLSLAVVKDGEIVYIRGFGLADGPKNIAATPDTVFQWMSITKIATAVAIFQLHERAALNIEDPVIKHLPLFEVHSPSTNGEQITIRHLLNHSSGLVHPKHMLGMVHVDGRPYPDQVELVKHLVAKYRNLKFEPGTRASYTNLGYTVLGAIVEVVSGQAHHEYLVEHIFRPLRMDNSNHVYTKAMRANAAVGSQPRGNIISALLAMVVEDPDFFIRETVNGRMWLKRASPDFSGGAGVNGPVGEAALFAAAFLNRGSLNGNRILSPESVAMMIEDGHIVAEGGPGLIYKGAKHGLGWLIWPNGGRQCIMHSGEGPGFSSIMQLYPEEGLGVVVMGNEWPYGMALRGTAIRDSIAHVAANIDWR
ncbi:MAG TPA: serine hydrolase [Anaerolineae bacterium]|jgi:CubicO group peptidase (beta-lactamase class C family)|nr:serine hydrolase [Anaerolineae bacterium]